MPISSGPYEQPPGDGCRSRSGRRPRRPSFRALSRTSSPPCRPRGSDSPGYSGGPRQGRARKLRDLGGGAAAHLRGKHQTDDHQSTPRRLREPRRRRVLTCSKAATADCKTAECRCTPQVVEAGYYPQHSKTTKQRSRARSSRFLARILGYAQQPVPTGGRRPRRRQLFGAHSTGRRSGPRHAGTRPNPTVGPR